MYKSLTIVALIVFFLAGQVSANSHVDIDFNDDRIVNKADEDLFRMQWGMQEGDPNWDEKFDLNGDRVIDHSDLGIFTRQLPANYLDNVDPDFSDDGIVNLADYDLFVMQWGTRAGDENWDAKFDLDGDRVIGLGDYDIFVFNWGKTFPVPLSERDVLVALYNATDGLNWTNNTNWLSNNDISTWYGVSVSNGLVTGLVLAGNQLTGEIPKELGNLTNLEELNLSFNKLSGEIPAALGNLSNLKKLWLVGNPVGNPVGNQLSGALPEELGNLTNLEVLILNYNQLSGPLPQSLTSLAKLMSFSFGRGTDLCAPSDAAFQTWLQGIADTDGPTCSE